MLGLIHPCGGESLNSEGSACKSILHNMYLTGCWWPTKKNNAFKWMHSFVNCRSFSKEPCFFWVLLTLTPKDPYVFFGKALSSSPNRTSRTESLRGHTWKSLVETGGYHLVYGQRCCLDGWKFGWVYRATWRRLFHKFCEVEWSRSNQKFGETWCWNLLRFDSNCVVFGLDFFFWISLWFVLLKSMFGEVEGPPGSSLSFFQIHNR